MSQYQKPFDKIKNIKGFTIKTGFSFTAISFFTYPLYGHRSVGGAAHLPLFPL